MARAEPRIVGHYAIYEEFASGGMASVHFARLRTESRSESEVARTLAAKRAHPHLARERDFALMFLDEGRTAMRVRHPNVVSTLDVLRTPDDLVLVMDYVHGESLWNLVRAAASLNEQAPVAIVMAIMVDMLQGLQAAHEATDEHGAPLGIVHRDVSPQNILVGADGVSRLVDFGIAKAAGQLHSTRDSSVKGKCAYMAPEQVRGEPVSALTDTYAASIVLWELLTGERLFAGKTEAETMHKVLVGRVLAPSLVAPELGARFDAVVKRGLSRDPSQRYASAQAMALDLQSCARGAAPARVAEWVKRIATDSLTTRASAIAAIESGEVRARRQARRRAMTSALAVGTAATAAVVVWLGMHRPPEASAAEGVPGPSLPVLASASAAAEEPVAISVSDLPLAAMPDAAVKAVAAPERGHLPPLRSHPPRRAACDPPYSIDREGKQIFKPQCM